VRILSDSHVNLYESGQPKVAPLAGKNGPQGIIGERVLALSQAEKLHRQQSVNNFKGLMSLMDAFQDLCLHGIDDAKIHRHVINVFALAFVVATCRRLRVALNEFYNGYYYDASSHLRAVFESVMYLGAVANGYIRYDALLEAGNRMNVTNTSERERLKIEREVQLEIDGTIKRRMRGKESGLSTDDQHELDQLFVMLHSHVHKSSSSVIELIGSTMIDNTFPMVAPTLDVKRASVFANVAVCVAWAFSRLLPCLSMPDRFSGEWRSRASVMEEAFRGYLSGWTSPISPAFHRFMESKLTFTDEAFRRFEVAPGFMRTTITATV
jgi:hypothetical protein